VVWHSGWVPVSASAWMVTSGRVQAWVLRPALPRVWQAARPLPAQEMTVAEPLDRTLAPTQEVPAGALYARHEVASVALDTTLEAAALHVRLEVPVALHTTLEAVPRATQEVPVALHTTLEAAPRATQEVPVALHARQEATLAALHATLEAAVHATQEVQAALHARQEATLAALHATLEATWPAVAEGAAVGPERRRQPEMRAA